MRRRWAGWIGLWALLACGAAQAAELPVVQLPTLEQGTMVRGQYLLDVVWKPADDGAAVTGIELFIDDQRVASLQVRPDQRNYVFPWDTAAVRDGRRNLTVRIEDAKGRTREYRSHAYVRNQGQPQPTRGTTSIEVIDLDSQPDGILTQRALIRVHVDERVGAKYVLLYVNDRFVWLGNRSPFEFRYDPAARREPDGAYQVRARIIHPDTSESFPEPVPVAINIGGTYTGMAPGASAPTVPTTVLGGPRPGGLVVPPDTAPGHLAQGQGRPAGSPDAPPAASQAAVPVTGPAPPVTAPALAQSTTRPDLPRPTAPAADTPRSLGPVPAPAAAAVTPVRPSTSPAAPSRLGPEPTTAPGPSAASATRPAAPAEPSTTTRPVPAEPTATRPLGPTAPAVTRPRPSTPAPTAPRPPAAGRPATPPTTVPTRPRTHVVARGESLTTVARRYGVSVRDLARINRLANPDLVRVGDTLTLPGPTGRLLVNGRTILTDVPALEIRHGVPMTAIRYVVEALGGTVEWESPLKSVRATIVDRGEIRITIGSNRAQVNDETVLMDLAAYLHGERTMVPTRFVRDALDVAVDLGIETGDLTIRSNR